MRRKVLRLLVPAAVILLAVGLCRFLYFITDNLWNGAFVDWFDRKFMRIRETYSWEVDDWIVLREIDWGKLKPFLLTVLTVGISSAIAAAFIISHLSARHEKRHTADRIGKMLHTCITEGAEPDALFRAEYSGIAAELEKLRSLMLQSKELSTETTQKNEMMTYLAHDLKTPLTSVIGYLSLLDESPDMPPEQKMKFVHVAFDKANRLEELVNEFFEITRYNMHQIELDKEEIDLYYMLTQMIDEFYPILSAKGNTAVLRANENLTVYGDPMKLARVFNNILKNAAAYSFPNSEIVIFARERNGHVVISFGNRGPTIPEDKLSSIFDRFYRLDWARSSDAGGAGLGLAIAKEIVTLHGGTITVRSRNNATAFNVSLPRQ